MDKQGLEVRKMKSMGFRPVQMQVEIDDLNRDRLVYLMIELIHKDRDLRKAILDVVLSCPNIVTEI